MISMIEAYKMYWRKSFVWCGRASRSEFWWPVLCNMIISYGISVLQFVAGPHGVKALYILAALFSFATIFPSLAVLIRRMHDLNKSAWIATTPYIVWGSILFIIILSEIVKYALGGYSFEILYIILGFTLIPFSIWVFVIFILTMLPGTPGRNKYDI